MAEPIFSLIQQVQQGLLPQLNIYSKEPYNPVIVGQVPPPWRCLGAGNYAAVFEHPDYPEQVVKVYAPGRPGIEDEIEVYQRIGKHPAFSQCYHSGSNFLILKRLHGITLYDCLNRGLIIPPQVIQDIDDALDYARNRGLTPHDVHGRNVMMSQGRGLVVDISDFLKPQPDRAWQDVKWAYQWVYQPVFMRLRLQIPYVFLDWVRGSYRLARMSGRVIVRSKKYRRDRV